MKMKSALRKILFITLPSFFIFLLVAELSLRIGGVLYTRYRCPETHAKTTETAQDSFNILCLGDSFTLGAGANPEDSYPRQLERILQKNVPISKDINIIDGGRGGNTSSLVLKNLQKDIHRYHPDVIIIMIGCNNGWNLKESSYFLLKRGNLGFQKRLDRLLNPLKVYKLIKIGCINLRHKIKEYKTVHESLPSDTKLVHKIESESVKLSNNARELVRRGEYDLAVEKLREAIAIDKTNYGAYLWLAHISNARHESQLAKEEIWNAIKAINEWSSGLVYTIISHITQLDVVIVNRELARFKKYLQDKYAGDRNRRNKLVKIIDVKLHLLENKRILDEILEYDLGEIIRLTEENNIRVILQTYPYEGWHANLFREVSERLDIPLVDNVMMFEERTKDKDIKDFFVADGHCNAQGYKLIAENVYAVLVETGVLSESQIRIRNGRR